MPSEEPERPVGQEERDEPVSTAARRESAPVSTPAPPSTRPLSTSPPAVDSVDLPHSTPQRSTPPPSAPPPAATGRYETYPPPPSDDVPETKEARRSRFENLLPGVIRRGIERGIEAGLNTFEKSLETGRGTTDAMREVLSEVKIPRDVASSVVRTLQEAKLPREIASAVFTQMDETKNDVLRIVAKEVRDFLEATDLATELKAALTSLSFEVRTEVRFIPNDAGAGVKPQVKARTRVKRAQDSRLRERSRRRSSYDAADSDDAEDDE